MRYTGVTGPILWCHDSLGGRDPLAARGTLPPARDVPGLGPRVENLPSVGPAGGAGNAGRRHASALMRSAAARTASFGVVPARVIRPMALIKSPIGSAKRLHAYSRCP